MTIEIPIPKGINPMSPNDFKKVFDINGELYIIESYHICNNKLVLKKIKK